eukprot:TRINITY_DN4665_c0_g1_i1.p1 TRINITY_DN4665_c0_g1~~TRINITY_DN4665_c0_g1_i1.p1  ORF type:complete len:417 (-),score=96.80 TRINITY_DN4665_c0_g1_i1:136-1386(-)
MEGKSVLYVKNGLTFELRVRCELYKKYLEGKQCASKVLIDKNIHVRNEVDCSTRLDVASPGVLRAAFGTTSRICCINEILNKGHLLDGYEKREEDKKRRINGIISHVQKHYVNVDTDQPLTIQEVQLAYERFTEENGEVSSHSDFEDELKFFLRDICVAKALMDFRVKVPIHEVEVVAKKLLRHGRTEVKGTDEKYGHVSVLIVPGDKEKMCEDVDSFGLEGCEVVLDSVHHVFDQTFATHFRPTMETKERHDVMYLESALKDMTEEEIQRADVDNALSLGKKEWINHEKGLMRVWHRGIRITCFHRLMKKVKRPERLIDTEIDDLRPKKPLISVLHVSRTGTGDSFLLRDGDFVFRCAVEKGIFVVIDVMPFSRGRKIAVADASTRRWKEIRWTKSATEKATKYDLNIKEFVPKR